MRFSSWLLGVGFLSILLGFVRAAESTQVITPKVVIVTLFEPERNAWLDRMSFPQNVSLPGGSPLFPYVNCDKAGDVCLITTGEGEINAASTLTAFLYNPRFDLRKSYFVVNGIAGINPHAGTVGSVSFTRYAIQLGLQYGLDSREIPKGWKYDFWNYGTSQPGEYPAYFYGTEVFEINTNLRDKVLELVKNVKLDDSNVTMANRANYSYAPANQPPTIFKGDVMTSDLYYTGKTFGQMATNLTQVLTNGTGHYAMTAQEDNAVLETLVRAHKAGYAEYGRAILYRTASDFDRAPPHMDDYEYFEMINELSGLSKPSENNLYLVGSKIVRAVRKSN